MKKIIVFTFCFFALTSCKKETIASEKDIQDNYAFFGDSISADNAISNEEMISKFEKLKAGDTLNVKFKSLIKNVCQKKGCCMTL